MAKRRLFWKVYPTYLFVILLCAAGLAAYTSWSVKRFHLRTVRWDLEARCRLLEPQFARELAGGTGLEVHRLARSLGEQSGTRITVVDPKGKVLGDTEGDPEGMENHSDRGEIVEAMAGDVGSRVRLSPTLRTNMMYVATAIEKEGTVLGVVRAAVPLADLEEELGRVSTRIWFGAFVLAVLAAGIATFVAERINLSLRQMVRAAARYGEGDFSEKVFVPDTAEFAELAETLNEMADSLNDKISTIISQNREHEAVLSSMMEGVVAVDLDQRIISMNSAAAEVLGVDTVTMTGRTVQEIARNVLLERFVDQVLSGQKTTESEVVLRNGKERRVLVHGTVLRNADDEQIGALLVLNDITALRRLELVRRDFVANVSHELRTPLTAIQGFVETLREGALKDSGKADRFLEIVSRQVERLNHIIEDLLALSRIERGEENQDIELVDVKLLDVMTAAAESCAHRAEERGIAIDVTASTDLRACVSPQLLEQALVNLLDNAITYSDEGGEIQVQAQRDGAQAVISVQDHGCGIPVQHHDRIFERFYCVDKARSRKGGGTGLGLAIVKHIARAHGGAVSVRSKPGEGSIFSIVLPLE